MIYNKLGRTGADISAVSLGAEHFVDKPLEQIRSVIDAAEAGGVNYIDVFMPQTQVRDDIGTALKGRRDKFMLAGHLGACLTEDGQYLRTRDAKLATAHIEDFIRRLGGDCVEMLMIHFVDEEQECDEVMAPGGLLDVARKLKEQGKARFLGLSSHVPAVAQKLVETGALDAVLFTVNPLHDTLGNVPLDDLFKDESYTDVSQGRSAARQSFYAACRRQGTSILTMKTYGAGRLLAPDAPLGVRLTPVQCIHYALSQPGVAAAVVGCKTGEEMEAALAYLNATDAERDFSSISGSRMFGARGACMYCNHCLPCPVGIDIAEVTRLLDAVSGAVAPALREAYAALEVPASSCLQCGAWASRCPFQVDAPANMDRAARIFEG